MNAKRMKPSQGITLIEVIVFLVIIGVALSSVFSVFIGSVSRSADPVIQIRALELAQAQLDDILSRKFDENTPTGGVPACDSTDGVACAGIASDSNFDDVGDFNGFVDSSNYTPYVIAVSVSEAGGDLGLSASQARLIRVTITTPATNRQSAGATVTLSAYKVNF